MSKRRTGRSEKELTVLPGSRRHDIIRQGLICSFLTSVASVVANGVFDGATSNAWIWNMARHFMLGYAAAAAVVVLAFPWVLPLIGHTAHPDERKLKSDIASEK
jgi:hypothetical protein